MSVSVGYVKIKQRLILVYNNDDHDEDYDCHTVSLPVLSMAIYSFISELLHNSFAKDVLEQ